MRIIITLSYLCKGSGLSNYIRNLIESFHVDNHEIYVITTHAIQPDFERVFFSSEMEVALHQLHSLSKWMRYLYLVRLVRSINPDLMISNYHAPTQFILPLCKKCSRVVHVIHNDTDDFYRVAFINARYVDGWICPTPGVREHFSQYTKEVYDNKITVIPHGVNEPFEFQIKPNLVERVEIVYVGVLYPHKGVLIIPSIVKYLTQRQLPFHLSIIGGGICENELRSAMKEEIASGQVELCGVLNHEEVYHRLSQAHVFLYPTRIDSFGLVIAEAMMNGAVPVVSHLKGITDALIDHDKNGILIDDLESGEQFGKAILWLYREPDMWQTLSENARKKAEKHFSLETFRKNYRSYFQKLLS